MINYFSISILLLICFQYNTALECWKCKEKDFPTECGALFTPKVDTQITSIECTDGVCVTFKNKYDGGTIVRNCTSGLWVPPTGKVDVNDPNSVHLVENCIKDKYSGELFCFCQKDLCNGNNTGDLTIFAINECLSNPCVNGGTCQDLYGKFKCTCPGNYAEPTCATCKPGFSGVGCTQILPSPCLSTPCLNSGVCTPDQAKYTYECKCATGFTGVNCETDINECASFPCKNNGICKDLSGKYECNCANTGYEGTNCDKDIDECTLNTNLCGSNGKCNNYPGTFNCTCNAGYTGKFCETDIDECSSNPCKSGVCTDDVNGYKCTCYKGYTGTNCETLIDYCADNDPCKNDAKCLNDYTKFKAVCICAAGWTGATCADQIDYCNTIYPCKFFTQCTNKVADWECTCKPGYEGKNCTDITDNCAKTTNPCKNNGKCVNQINDFACICAPGYTGKDCSEDINECASNPCLNGKCDNLVNAFKCTCDPGYTGVKCEIDINECASNPCRNQGTCVDLVNKYACICNETYYTGVRCERPRSRCFEPEGVEPCNENGDCEGGIGFQDITCTCYSGYTGKFCETKVSKCSTVACLNGGTCLETATTDGFRCACNANFTGALCQTRISACKDQNINCNNGVCVDTGSTYKCECFSGYNGALCTNKYFTCTEVGTFPDPFYCEKYFYCTTDATGKLVAQSNTCALLSPYQLLFDSDKKNCVFPAKHPNPGCYTTSG